MKLLKRTMEVESVESNYNYCDCQASFNSDGCLTIRRYNHNDKNTDEILCLNEVETYAIINLFKEMKRSDMKGLPF